MMTTYMLVLSSIVLGGVLGALAWQWVIENCKEVSCEECPFYKTFMQDEKAYLSIQGEQVEHDTARKVRTTLIRGSKVDIWG